MKYITRIQLSNFKRFKSLNVEVDKTRNILIGDNESGKSTILTAIDLVLSGSRNKVEAIGLENLFNVDVISEFLKSEKKYENLPVMEVELYFCELNNEEIAGRNNSRGENCDGFKLICSPNDEFGVHIKDALTQPNAKFPFEYYSVDFKTFSDQAFNGYKRYVKHLFIDTAQTSSEYAMKEYVKDVYTSTATPAERLNHQHQYRVHKDTFKNSVFKPLNDRTVDYSFGIRTGSKSNVETDLAIFENEIGIEHKGKGRQCFIKADLALKRGVANLDIVLFEEPENHLSHIYTKKLVHKIAGAENKQVFITTHSDMICTRLDLRKAILLNSNNLSSLLLRTLPEETARFFIKAPGNNILQFVLSKKVILVEGDAEYILMDAMYSKSSGSSLDADDVHVISVDGTSFKRYLDIAKHLKIKTAVIRDNDGNYQKNCVDNYRDYASSNIKVFAETDASINTFEISFYKSNMVICDSLFKESRRSLSVQDYMLSNKTDAAFSILDKKSSEITVPQYIKDAVTWIKS